MIRKQKPRSGNQNSSRNGVEQANPVLDNPRERDPHEAGKNAAAQGKGRGLDHPERNGDALHKDGREDAEAEESIHLVATRSASVR